VLHVTLLGDEWGSSAGGLSTINRELAIHLSNHSAVKVSLLVPEGACNYEEKSEAHTYGVTIVEAKRLAAFDRLDWLSFPPREHFMDVVVGHGVKLGRQVQVIRDSPQFSNCKWVQVVHTAPEDLSRYKCYSDPISKGEAKHESEVELCKLADLVVPVGPKLKEAYTSYLQRWKTDQDVLSVTPGVFHREFGDLVAKQDPYEDGEFKVLLFGQLSDEQSKIVHETLQRQILLYFQHRTIATSEGVSGLIEYIKKTHNVALESVGLGSLEVKFRCTSLESLESLWNDYQSGHLNHIAERYLVTDDIRRKLNFENVRLKTTIDEENYKMCEKILKEKS
ncbi:unnamed protein product, partial [Porites lobata]